MNYQVNIIKASCKGQKDATTPNQDYIKKSSNDSLLVVSVSDGLGSSNKSLDGAKLACRVVWKCVQAMLDLPDWNGLATAIPHIWNAAIQQQEGDKREYRTTNSFVAVVKKRKQIIVGRLGDVLVAVRLDGKLHLLRNTEKDFINETECLGSHSGQEYKIDVFEYREHFEFLLASDGIGDELEPNTMEFFLDYLKSKYHLIKVKKRNKVLKKEITQYLAYKNNDDKSLVFAWSK